MCCSAATWIAAQADKVFANSSATVGSIGVYCTVTDFSKLYDNAGVKVNLIKAGEFKGAGVQGLPVTDAQIAEWQKGIDEIYAMFIQAVAAGRDMSVEAVTALATGQVWIAGKAMDLGLIDGVGTLEDVFDELSGVAMATANKTQAFGLGKAAAAKADEAAPAVEAAAASTAVAKAAEPTPAAAVVETPAAVATAAPTADQLTAAGTAAVAQERERTNGIIALAPDHPQFALDQIKSGSSISAAAVAYTALLAGELKTVRAAIPAAKTEETGAKAVALANAEKRDSDGGSGSFIKIKRA